MEIEAKFVSDSLFENRAASFGKFKYVRIAERSINLTVAQAIKPVELCQRLSDLYRDIYLFRFSPVAGTIYILARENIEIVISQDGTWEFI